MTEEIKKVSTKTPKIGDKLKIKIIDIGIEGEGIGKTEDNFTVFVRNALPGDAVIAKIIKTKTSFANATIESFIEKTDERITPICPVFESCGGCTIQNLDYKTQLKYKQKRVNDCLQRIGNSQIKVNEIVPSDNPFYYRNKVTFQVKKLGDKVVIGFFEMGSHRILEVNKCFILPEKSAEIIEIIKNHIIENNISIFDVRTGKGEIRNIVLRFSQTEKTFMAIIVSTIDKIKKDNVLIEKLEKIEGFRSLVLNINKNKFGENMSNRNKIIFGEDKIYDCLGDKKFAISANSFFQINTLQTKKLYDKVVELSGFKKDEIVLDAYCGTGSISLFISDFVKEVVGVEIVENAIKDAKANAIINKTQNATFILGDAINAVKETIELYEEKGEQFTTAIIDPPRKGCDRKVIDDLIESEIKKIVYVSCDPSTLSRDLKIFLDQGYKIKEAASLDLFSQSMHVESVVVIEK